MIIKSVNINSFGGIKNKKINFSKGLNIVLVKMKPVKVLFNLLLKYGFMVFQVIRERTIN